MVLIFGDGLDCIWVFVISDEFPQFIAYLNIMFRMKFILGGIKFYSLVLSEFS